MQHIGKLNSIVALLCALSCPLHAQRLNFDEVCAAPPCAAASAYASSWGITIGPAGLSIVAQGTAGLSGIGNPSFLLVNSTGFQTVFSLPRLATFATVEVARSNLSSATQSVTLQALLNGAAVAPPQTVQLTTVNKWSSLTISLPSAFNGISLSANTGGANRTFGVDNVRFAGNCAGFVEVAPGEVCDAAEWLYNRAITRGCALGTFCPAANVTRAQMALFMQRLGKVLTPTILSHINQVQVDPTTGPDGLWTLCSVAHFPVSPTVATAMAMLLVVRPSGTGDFAFVIQYSTDNGVTWQFFPNSWNTAATVGANQVGSQSTFSNPLPLDMDKQYQFAARVQRQLGPTETNNFFCALQVRIENVNPQNPPYDAAVPAVDAPSH